MSHLPLFASSPIFPPTSQTPTTLLEHDEHLIPFERSYCDDLRQSGGSTQTVTQASQRSNSHQQARTLQQDEHHRTFWGWHHHSLFYGVMPFLFCHSQRPRHDGRDIWSLEQRCQTAVRFLQDLAQPEARSGTLKGWSSTGDRAVKIPQRGQAPQGLGVCRVSRQ